MYTVATLVYGTTFGIPDHLHSTKNARKNPTSRESVNTLLEDLKWRTGHFSWTLAPRLATAVDIIKRTYKNDWEDDWHENAGEKPNN